MNNNNQQPPAGALSAEVACYAGPLAETTVREAAEFLYAMRQSISERIMILEGEGRRRAAAAKTRQLDRITVIIRELEAALHNAQSPAARHESGGSTDV